MQRENEINALIVRARDQLREIKAEYEKSLHEQKVSDLLKVDIKNFCENLRSTLDYLAHTIRETHCPTANARTRFYFPIFQNNQSYASQMSNWYPGLNTSAPVLYQYLETIQPYQQGFEWLGKFNKLNNENKHGNLVEQTRHEEVKRITARSNSGSEVSWNPSSVRFGSGVHIHGAPVDPSTQMPVPSGAQTITKTIWVDFKFAGIGESAISLLETSLAGIEAIVVEVKKHV